MKSDNSQLFMPGCWLGEGSFIIGSEYEPRPYFLRWRSTDQADVTQNIQIYHEMQLADSDHVMASEYLFSEVHKNAFNVAFKSSIWGNLKGKGFLEKDFIGWEYLDEYSHKIGFESYEKTDEDYFRYTAAFSLDEYTHSRIEGEFWKYSRVSKEIV